jgi:hypothetical protein
MEIKQNIIIMSGDFNIACYLGDVCVITKMFDREKHTWEWACMNGHLEVVKFLHQNRSEALSTLNFRF